MKIDIIARHVVLSEDIKDYVQARGQRVARYFEAASRCEVIIDLQSLEHTVEIKVHAPRNDLTAKHTHTHIHAAVDGALDKIEEQVRRLKERFKDHHRGERPPERSPTAETSKEPSYDDVLRDEL